MFLRVKNNKQGLAYLIVEESYTDDKGKAKKRHLKILGRYDLMILDNPNILTELRSLIRQSKFEFIERYLNNEEFKNKYSKTQIKTVVEADITNYGCEIHKELWSKLKLDKLFNKLQKSYRIKYSLSKLILYLASMRIIDQQSKLENYKRQARYSIGVDYDLNVFYSSLEILANHKEEIENHLYSQTLKHTESNERDIVLFDVTTFYFESQREDELRSNGYSKDGKYADVQVVYGLAILENGLPIHSETYSGRTSEVHTLMDCLVSLKEKYNSKKVIIICDRGLASKVNFAKIKELGLEYIFGFRLGKVSNKLKEEVYANKPEDKKYIMIDHKITVNNKSHISKLVIGYSKLRASREKAILKKLEEKAKELISRSSTLKQAMATGAKSLIRFDIDEPELDEVKLDKRIKEAGLFALCSSQDLPPEEVHRCYSRLWKIEESFRIMKTTLETRPIYVWKAERVRGHILTSFLALYMQRFIEYKLKEAGYKYTTNMIVNTIKSLVYTYSKKTKTTHRVGYDQCFKDIEKTVLDLRH